MRMLRGRERWERSHWCLPRGGPKPKLNEKLKPAQQLTHPPNCLTRMDLLFSIPFAFGVAFGVASGDVFFFFGAALALLGLYQWCPSVGYYWVFSVSRASSAFGPSASVKGKHPHHPPLLVFPRTISLPRPCLGSHHSSTSFSVCSPCNALWKPIEWNAFFRFFPSLFFSATGTHRLF